MKKIIGFSLLVMSFAAQAAAQPDSGTINFTGTIVAPTCNINNGNSSLEVDLGTISASSVLASGQAAGSAKEINISVSCPVASAFTKVTTSFNNSSNTISSSGNLILTPNGALNVEIGLSKTAVYSASKIHLANDSVEFPIAANGSATIKYFAQYVGTGQAVQPGLAKGTLIYTLNYN